MMPAWNHSRNGRNRRGGTRGRLRERKAISDGLRLRQRVRDSDGLLEYLLHHFKAILQLYTG